MARSRRTNSDPRQPLTDAELEAYAVSYLSRFDCTVARITEVLLRKLGSVPSKRKGDEDGETASNVTRNLESVGKIVERFVEVGYLNDERFARALAGSLLTRGTAPRRTVERLKQRGVRADLADSVVRDCAASGETELVAAARLVRRKKLGWCRSDEAVRKARAQKDLAALARAGFSFDVARRVLTGPIEEELF